MERIMAWDAFKIRWVDIFQMNIIPFILYFTSLKFKFTAFSFRMRNLKDTFDTLLNLNLKTIDHEHTNLNHRFIPYVRGYHALRNQRFKKGNRINNYVTINCVLFRNSNDRATLIVAKVPGDNVAVEVYSQNGVLMSYKNLKPLTIARVRFDLSQLPSGNYTFKVVKGISDHCQLERHHPREKRRSHHHPEQSTCADASTCRNIPGRKF
jgi:hypothetical protein